MSVKSLCKISKCVASFFVENQFRLLCERPSFKNRIKSGSSTVESKKGTNDYTAESCNHKSYYLKSLHTPINF